jgi:SAM-dependent methyltransferase
LPLDPEDIKIMRSCMEERPLGALSIPSVRHRITMSRLQRLEPGAMHLMGNPNPAVIENTIEHNLKGLAVCLDRPERMLGILPSMQYVRTNLQNLRVLTVGPRSESELFFLVSLGFRPENIRGLDLISYSSSVDLGDMHDMPYGVAQFDIIALSGCLGYSTDNAQVVREVVRVAKDHAIVAVLEEYSPKTNEQLMAEGSLLKTKRPRYSTCEDLLKLFEGHIQAVAFRHDITHVPPAMLDQTIELIVVFTLKKGHGSSPESHLELGNLALTEPPK